MSIVIVDLFQPMASRVQTTPKAAPEYDVEYEDYSARYASPPKKGQAVLGYRSISPNKMPYPSYDTVDSAGNEPFMYGMQKSSGGRPDIRDGAEAGDAVRSRLHFSAGDSEERRDAPNSSSKDSNPSTPFSRHGKEYQSPYIASSASAQYDPMQYQDKVGRHFLALFALKT